MARRTYSATAVKSAFDRAYVTDSLARVIERQNGTAGQFQKFYYDAKDRFWFWEKWGQTGTPTCLNTGGYGYDCSDTTATRSFQLGTSYDNVENPTDLGSVRATGNRLTSYNGFSNMTYDLDGNLTAKGTYTYEWDDFGQLNTVRQAGVVKATFDYDGFGRRVRKVASGTTIQYVWDRGQVILEADASGATTQEYSYYPGIDRLHSVTGNVAGNYVTYYASIEPATGDVNGLIKATGDTVKAQYSYTPWGEFDTPDQPNVDGVRVNSFRWKGLAYDAETGLYYMRARYYDPTLRRFISEDPIGLAGGINMYAFAAGDPMNGSDPSGLRGCTDAQIADGGITDTDPLTGHQWCVMPAGLPPIVVTPGDDDPMNWTTPPGPGGGGVPPQSLLKKTLKKIGRAISENAPSVDCLVKAGVFGAGLGLDVVSTVGAYEGVMALGYVVEAGSLSLKTFAGNYVAHLGRTFGAIEQKALLTSAGGNMILANPAYFGNDGFVSGAVASAGQPGDGDFTWKSLIPFSGTADRWEAASLACGQ
jgi:RHS repeat-associated protein